MLAVGVVIAHFTGVSATDELGREIYPSVPRGWQLVLIGQLIALGGVLVAMAGASLAFLYKRDLTWARAALGATMFTGLMIILFGVIPNQWLTLTQATWEWTPQKIALTIPRWLVLNNEVTISAAAVKDIVVAGYVGVVIGAVASVMRRWQVREDKVAAPPPQLVSGYGRPLTKFRG